LWRVICPTAGVPFSSAHAAVLKPREAIQREPRKTRRLTADATVHQVVNAFDGHLVEPEIQGWRAEIVIPFGTVIVTYLARRRARQISDGTLQAHGRRRGATAAKCIRGGHLVPCTVEGLVKGSEDCRTIGSAADTLAGLHDHLPPPRTRQENY
jgi:hypothetical protein